MGVDRDLSGEPHNVLWLLDPPITLAEHTCDRLTFEHFAFDPSVAPVQKSMLRVYFKSSGAYWRGLSHHRVLLKARKQQVASAVIEQSETRLPALSSQVEIIEVVVDWRGSAGVEEWEGLQSWRPDRGVWSGKVVQTLPRLQNFYLIGPWDGAVDILPAAVAGYKLIQGLCRRDRRPFLASLGTGAVSFDVDGVASG